MGPDYCGNCRKLSLPCSRGLADEKGRRCPQFEHACKTYEGEAVWDAASRAGGWTGGGMTPRRIDRAAVRARLNNIEGWIVEDMLDAFEPAALAAEAVAAKRDKAAPKSKASPEGEVG